MSHTQSLFRFLLATCTPYVSFVTSTANPNMLLYITLVLPLCYITLASSSVRKKQMSSGQQKSELDARARQGETVIPGGTGGKSLEAQQNLAEGRSRGGQTRREQLGAEGYQEMGRKGGLSTGDQSGGERAAKEGIEIDESKFTTRG